MLSTPTQTPLQSLNKAYRKEKVSRKAIDRLKAELPRFLDLTSGDDVSESTLRDHLQHLLREVWYPNSDYLVQSEVRRMDTIIHDGAKKKDPVGVIVEAKTLRNSQEMWHPRSRPNAKALHELILYFVRERAAGNVALKTLVITNGDDTYLFADRDFERLFWEKKRWRKQLLALDADAGKNNPVAYEHIQRHVAELDEELPCTALSLSDYRRYCEDGRDDTDEKLIPLYKVLGPVHLLRRPFANDSNKLDKRFYRELLHIIGLEEVSVDSKGKVKKSGGKKIIRRLPPGRRHAASLLENVIDMAGTDNRFRHVTDFSSYGSDRAEREFAVAIELCITWVNRILFLKLLESQLVAYHSGVGERGGAYRFLTKELVPDYDGLHTLFFKVLARRPEQRQPIVAAFHRVPYLNSSLFEPTELEEKLLYVHALKDQFTLPLHERSVLSRGGEAHPLHYLFDFLDAYDFGGGGGAIQEENKRLINASVLGLIFEKINGYRDGSFYTPGFITEYMCRETVRRAVVQKFREAQGSFADFDAETFTDLQQYLSRKYRSEEIDAANKVVDSITVCDPAVGSGHFLVSALNELIAVKAELKILGGGAAGAIFNREVQASVVNDELLLTYRSDGRPFEYRVHEDGNGKLHVDDTIQTVQRTLFEEKRTLIENCLFGVDINPNSVKICRLRLWIELLKHAYYVIPTQDERSEQSHAAATSHIENRISNIAYLQTLPNIDINIKRGNSLVSRFALEDDLSGALADSDRYTLDSYRVAVAAYHRATGPDEKRELLQLIDEIKGNFQSHISRNDKKVKALAKSRGRLEQLESLLGVGDLFGSVDAKAVKKEIKPLTTKVAKLEAEIAGIRSNTIYNDAFEWRFEFPAVLGQEGEFLGFDVVVGNPPYIRQEEVGDLKPYLQDHYEVYAGTADLLVYFIELAMRNLRPAGQFSFIISNKFMRAGFGKALRKYLQQYRIVELIDFGDLQVFDGATTYPLVISLENQPPQETFLATNVPELDTQHFREQLNSHRFPSLQQELTEDGWNLADVATQQLLKKLQQTGVPLGEYVDGEIYYGIKTGYNQAFVIDEATRERLIEEDANSAEIIKPFLAGRDVKRYVPPVADKYLILFEKGWTKEIAGKEVTEEEGLAILESRYPAIANWLSDFEEAAKKRYDQGDFWWELRACDYYGEFERPKIFYPDFGLRFNATISTSGEFGVNTLYFLTTAEPDILGLLNSELISFYFRSVSNSVRGGYYRFFSQYVLEIPVATALRQSDRINSMVTEILAQIAQDPQADTTPLEAQIDLLVYHLYDLTHAEVLVVDPDFGMGEEAYLAAAPKAFRANASRL